jgi:hypothetical protein
LTLVFFGFIRNDPLYPRHPRSIAAFFAANINCRPVHAIENRYGPVEPGELATVAPSLAGRF